MVYMGDVFSGEGLRLSSDGVKGIVEAPAFQKLSEERSFLGSVQFCAKFIPNFNCYNVQSNVGPDQGHKVAMGS